jgi:glutaconyl-CoA/methylmalonyl-CoA decarboxylase subunit gamma
MRRYRLGVGDREFVVDVQELAADRFDVVVGEQRYEVTLTGDEELATPIITPSLPAPGSDAGPGSTPRAASKAAVPRPRAQPAAAGTATARPASTHHGGGAALGAPMPGVILEIHVKAGDTVQRGQQIAVLDAMKMHNIIGAPRAGTIVEVCVDAGQAVGHGDPIVRFAEG